MKKIKILSLLALAISLTGCHKNSEGVLRIAASPTPHAELLYSLEKEAQSLGLQFKILPIEIGRAHV